MITILCSGSRGDIQPYIALAQEIKQRGESVRIAAGVSFKEFIEGYGVECFPLSADQNTVKVDPKLLEAAANSTNPMKMLLTFNQMKKYARILVDDMYSACQGSDVIVYHPGCTVGYFAAEQMGIPSVLASPFPMLKTKTVPSVIAYGKSKIPTGLSYLMIQKMLWMASSTGIASFWKEKFGRLPQRFSAPYERTDERHPSVVSCSNYVFPRPDDWNRNVYQSGYWFVNETEAYRPPAKLTDFLASGDKPVYFGFGSMFAGKDKEFFVTRILEALQGTGLRAVIGGMGQIRDLPDNIIAVPSVPHTWLFPRMKAVCHHGGAGTSAAGFAAGVPCIIVPFSNDQFAWAHRAYDIGVGAKPIYRKDLTAKKLQEALSFVLSENIAANAKRLGEQIASEHGAEACAEVIVNLKK